MKVQEIMERVGMTETGRAVAYIKDGLEEIEMYTKENVLSGKKGTLTTSNTISFENTTLPNTFFYETSWAGASTSDGQTDLPTGWVVWDTSGPPEFRRVSADGTASTYALQIKLTSVNQIEGLSKSYAVTPGVQYNIKFHKKFVSASGALVIGTAQGLSEFYTYTAGGGDSEFTEVSSTFTPTSSTIHVTININAAESAGDIILIDDVQIWPVYHLIKESGNLFTNTSNFEPSMKLKVDGSTSNDTDESDNATNGYYTIKERATDSSAITVEEELNTETISSLNTIKLTATNQNFMDIIANKRYYPLPDDMLNLVSVKLKNHLNNEDKYREVPRMIHKPLEQDSDDI